MKGIEMDIEAERAYPTPFANSTLLPLLLLSLMKQKNSPDTARVIKKEYDYVVVGAGSAGSVVAARLSEIPCVSVLLLEAGKPPPYLTEVPGIARSFWGTDVDWNYRTVPQRHTGRLLINRQVVWPSGKMIGGTSNLNGMIFIRGNRKNYDNWAAEGAEGWSYKDVFPYFLKMEDNKEPKYVANGYHGVGGPITVQRPQYNAEVKIPILKAAKGLGHKIVDSNAARQTGFYDHQANIRHGQRCSTAKAYLVPAENRTNLDILPNAMVRKVAILNRRAVGVQFDFQGMTYMVKARREVILSAGTTNTAQLLMLSGIGPRKELQRHQIPVIADLPVGRNFHDHCAIGVHFELSPVCVRPSVSKVMDPAIVAQYIHNRTGPYTSTEFITEFAWGKGDLPRPKVDFPNFQLTFAEGAVEFGAQIGMTPESIAQFYGPYEGKPFFSCFSNMLQPRSRGTVTLNSTDPYDPPVIDPNYLADPRDMDDVVDGLKLCNRIGNSPELRRLGSVPFRTVFPGCEPFVGNEDALLRCMIKAAVTTYNHQVGTARMGHPKDPRTVVDPQLRVKTIKGLRVVDASVMPIVPSSNTNVPTIMVAEKASDIIKATIECRESATYEKSCPLHDDSTWIEKEHYPSYPDSESYVPDVYDEELAQFNEWEREREFSEL